MQNLKLSLARCHSVTLIHGNKLSIKICLNVRESDRKCFFLLVQDLQNDFSKESITKKCKRKVQGVPQLQTAALPRAQEKEELTNPNKNKSNKRTKITKISSLFPKRGNRNAKRTEKHKNKMTKGKT